jgi:hypothetical protein
MQWLPFSLTTLMLALAFKAPSRVPRWRIGDSSHRGLFVYKNTEVKPSFIRRFQSHAAPDAENMKNETQIDPFELEKLSLEKEIEVNLP